MILDLLTRLPARAVLVAIVLSASGAAANDTLRVLQFSAGASSATVDGSVVRGDTDVWSFSANAGQEADITVTSTEDNAAFSVFVPPATTDGDPTAADVKHWQGALPSTGTYYVQVGGDRGNATYKLTVSIK